MENQELLESLLRKAKRLLESWEWVKTYVSDSSSHSHISIWKIHYMECQIIYWQRSQTRREPTIKLEFELNPCLSWDIAKEFIDRLFDWKLREMYLNS